MYEHTVYDIIRALMTKQNLSFNQLAKKSQIPQSTIASMFSRQTKIIKVETLSKIATALGKEWYHLVDAPQTPYDGNAKISTELGEETTIRLLYELVGPDWESYVDNKSEPTIRDHHRNSIISTLDKLNENGMQEVLLYVLTLAKDGAYLQKSQRNNDSNQGGRYD